MAAASRAVWPMSLLAPRRARPLRAPRRARPLRALGRALCLLALAACLALAPRVAAAPAPDAPDHPGAATAPAPDTRASGPEGALAATAAVTADAAAPEPALSAAELTRWHARLDARLGKPARPVITIFNTWTHEYLPVDDPSEISQERIDRFFRCHFTGQPTRMDPRLFAALVAAARHFRVHTVHIVSGFRAPKYNLMLRKKGREVARDSQHTQGSAVDFRLPGVAVEKLHAWARQQRLGGVGVYLASKFVHMDTGRIRYWNGR
jgi:uncharacterized protein YcbK (DUF882 family)